MTPNDDEKLLPFDLTAKEQEVLYWLGQGLNNTEIGEKLIISSKTVKNHVSSILAKLGAKNRTAAVVIAWRTGFVDCFEEKVKNE